MTKPNLDEKRDALAEAHANPQGVWDYADGQQVADFVAGWNAALAALRDVPGEFDSDACDRALEAKGYTETNSFFAGRYAASWQFSRDKERIAALTAVCDAQVVTLVELNERVAALESALEFYAERRLYVNVGLQNDLYTDAGKRARQALKRDGGE